MLKRYSRAKKRRGWEEGRDEGEAEKETLECHQFISPGRPLLAPGLEGSEICLTSQVEGTWKKPSTASMGRNLVARISRFFRDCDPIETDASVGEREEAHSRHRWPVVGRSR